MKDLAKYVIGCSPEFIENDCDEYNMYIDIAVEFELGLFEELGLNSKPDKNGYIENDLGVFYYNGDCCWFWAVTNKSTRSHKFDHVGDFYLTDSESGRRVPARKKIWRDFKKAIAPKLDKALQEFAEEYELTIHVSREQREQENYINDQCY